MLILIRAISRYDNKD